MRLVMCIILCIYLCIFQVDRNARDSVLVCLWKWTQNGKFVTEAECSAFVHWSTQRIPRAHCSSVFKIIFHCVVVDILDLMLFVLFILRFCCRFSLLSLSVSLFFSFSLYKSTGEAKHLDDNGSSTARYGHTSENVCGKYI